MQEGNHVYGFQRSVMNALGSDLDVRPEQRKPRLLEAPILQSLEGGRADSNTCQHPSEMHIECQPLDLYSDPARLPERHCLFGKGKS